MYKHSVRLCSFRVTEDVLQEQQISEGIPEDQDSYNKVPTFSKQYSF